ncbi:MAG: GxxExxY protein [Patescibacteria group bacterium]
MKKRRNDLIYPKLSYKLVGIAFNIHNKLGGDLREKSYETAFAKAMDKAGVEYKRQLNMPIQYLETKVANRFFDFLINNKVVVELKIGGRFLASDIQQVHEYLKIFGLQLGIIINFGKKDVKFKRVLNLE